MIFTPHYRDNRVIAGFLMPTDTLLRVKIFHSTIKKSASALFLLLKNLSFYLLH